MPVWSLPLVEEQPEATLDSWRAFEVQIERKPAPTLHLAGYAVEAREGRVTSAIVDIDLPTRKVRTASGRVYHLVGGPGFNGDAEYVWARWLRINDAQVLREASDDFWTGRSAAH